MNFLNQLIINYEHTKVNIPRRVSITFNWKEVT